MKNKLTITFLILGALVGFFLAGNTALAANPIVHIDSISKDYVSSTQVIKVIWTLNYVPPDSAVGHQDSINFWTNPPYSNYGLRLTIVPFINTAPPTSTDLLPSTWNNGASWGAGYALNGYGFGFPIEYNLFGEPEDTICPNGGYWRYIDNRDYLEYHDYRCGSQHFATSSQYVSYLPAMNDGSSTKIAADISNGDQVKFGFAYAGHFDTGTRSYTMDPETYYVGGTNSIAITFPVASTTGILDFGHFEISAHTLTAFNYVRIKVITITDQYGPYTDWGTISAEYGALNDWLGVVDKNTLLANTQWASTAFLYDPNGNLLATSPQISYEITKTLYEGGGGVFIPTSTQQLQITCDPNSNWFQFSICNTLVFLFVPDAAKINQIAGVYDGVKNKPPFGYFYAIQTTFADLSASTTPAFTMPDLSALDDTIFGPLKTGLAWCLWLLFGFWVFSKFRHIQL